MYLVRVEPHDGFVVVVLVLAQRREVEAVGDAACDVRTEVAPTHSAVAELEGYLAIDAFDVAAGIDARVCVEEGLLPRVAEFAVDDGDAWEESEVEVFPDAEVAYDGDVEAGVVVRGDALHGVAQLAVLGELEVELGRGVAHLNAVVQQTSVERAEVVYLPFGREGGKEGRDEKYEP